ncbi:MAG TPA: hypothetical protein VGM56_23785 [Byssovorax sp.]
MDLDETPRFPSLALPFTALGATVGWSAVRLLENPIVDVSANASPELAATIGGLIACAIGAFLTAWGRRQAARDDMWIRPSSPKPMLVVTMLAGGTAAGAAVGVASGHRSGLESGAVCGVFVALVALPLAAAVLAAGMRARRARHGSLVAAADRRAVWVMCAAAAALASAVTVVDWPALAVGQGSRPVLGVAIAALCVVVAALALARDLLALRRVAVISADPRLRAIETPPSTAAPRVDLGLGDAVQAEVVPGANAYRALDKERRLVVGSVAEARAALRRAVVQAGLGVAVAGAVVGLHAVAMSELGVRAVTITMCARHTEWCLPAARSAAVDGASAEHVQHLLGEACMTYSTASCRELSAYVGAVDDAGAHVSAEAVLALVRTCQGGVGTSCYAVVRHVRHGAVAGVSVDELLHLGCAAGDAESCGRLADAQKR